MSKQRPEQNITSFLWATANKAGFAASCVL
jgi:hypothetical protein